MNMINFLPLLNSIIHCFWVCQWTWNKRKIKLFPRIKLNHKIIRALIGPMRALSKRLQLVHQSSKIVGWWATIHKNKTNKTKMQQNMLNFSMFSGRSRSNYGNGLCWVFVSESVVLTNYYQLLTVMAFHKCIHLPLSINDVPSSSNSCIAWVLCKDSNDWSSAGYLRASSRTHPI